MSSALSIKWTRKRIGWRKLTAEAAAAAASERDARFAPHRLQARALALWLRAQADHTEGLVSSISADSLHKGLDPYYSKPAGFPLVSVVGVYSVSDESRNRAVIALECPCTDRFEGKKIKWSVQYWTLGLEEGQWQLKQVEDAQAGARHLTAPLVSDDFEDLERVRDQTRIELAVEEAPAVADTARIVERAFAGEGYEELLDLSLADARCCPAVITASCEELLKAWALDGEGHPDVLSEIASEEAIYFLRHPWAHRTAVMRAPSLRSISVLQIEKGETLSLLLLVEFSSLFWIHTQGGCVVGGDDSRVSVQKQYWRLELTEGEFPWSLAEASKSRKTKRVSV